MMADLEPVALEAKKPGKNEDRKGGREREKERE